MKDEKVAQNGVDAIKMGVEKAEKVAEKAAQNDTSANIAKKDDSNCGLASKDDGAARYAFNIAGGNANIAMGGQ